MGTSKDAYIYYTVKYRGDYRRIEEAIQNAEPFSFITYVRPCMCITDREYPDELRCISDPPMVLFYEGNTDLLKMRKISVVGSRLLSEYGKSITEKISSVLSERYVIVSGMAKGTDGIAQSAAVRTVGVLGNGLDVVYPKENRKLYDEVRRNGLLLSEYPDGTPPSKTAFPFRNRIIAALGEKVIVPACRIRGGTLTTVNAALSMGKDVYTVPYPWNDPTGEGCNRLIQDGAGILVSAEDLKEL